MNGSSHPQNGSPAWVERQETDYTALNNSDEPRTFDGQAKVYQWDGDFGEVGPRVVEIELELFGDPKSRHDRAGLDFSR